MSGLTPGRAAPRFVPLAESGLTRWGRPRNFDFLRRMAWLPIADTELLHLSHYVPIGVEVGEKGPQVVALVHPFWCPKGPIDAQGRWVAGYVPMALRSFPFRSGPADGAVEVAPDLAASGEAEFALRDQDGAHTAEFALVLDLLMRVGRGAARLAEAAKALLLADLLVPLQPIHDDLGQDVHVVNHDGLLALGPGKAAALTLMSHQAFDLATASLFSQRWLDTQKIDGVVTPQRVESAGLEPALTTIDDAVERLMVMDESELFSFEAFQAAEARQNG